MKDLHIVSRAFLLSLQVVNEHANFTCKVTNVFVPLAVLLKSDP